MTYTSRFVGIDISKSSFDLTILPDARSGTFPNTIEGIAQCMIFLTTVEHIERLVVEPTGGYERLVVRALQDAKLPVAVVNAKQVRLFARACGQLSKTDRIDAFILADYGRRMETRIVLEQSAQHVMLSDLVTRYRQLTHMIVQEKNRKDKLISGARDWIRETLQFLLSQRQRVVAEMTTCIASDPELERKAAILMSLKGIGLRTACFLLAGLPELGLLDKGQIAKLTGVAPLNRDSGLLRGRRMIAGGRQQIRDALYVAALPAIRYDPIMKAFYQKLKEKGKPGKVALVAVMRKMIIILNAKMRDANATVLDC